MEGIIGRFYTFLGIPVKGEHPYEFHVHVIKLTLVLLKLHDNFASDISFAQRYISLSVSATEMRF